MTPPRRRRAVLFTAVVLLAGTGARADLSADADAALADRTIARAVVGVQVVRLGPTVGDAAVVPRVVYRHAAAEMLTPASNLKLLTTSAALDRFGPDFAFRTRLVLHGRDLILVGDGDPALGDAELLGRVGWDVDTVFDKWAEQLRRAGVTRVDRVAVDDTVFDSGELFHPHWPDKQRLKRYEAEVAGLGLNANLLLVFVRPTSAGRPVAVRLDPPTEYATIADECLTGHGPTWVTRPDDANAVTVHGHADVANTEPISIPVHDPALYAGTVLAERLAAGGVAVANPAVTRDRAARAALAAADPAYRVVASTETPLSTVLARANKDSVNLYGECLCKRLGADANGGGGGTWANGTAAVAAFCRKVGVPEGQVRLDDGCGLSKENAVTAAAVTQVLTFDFAGPHAQPFLDSLAVAGTDGTLSERFARSNLRGRVLAKSGTVDGVSCLSGYLHARDGQWYAFAILMNRVPPGGVGRPIQERIVKAIDDNAGG